MDGYEYEVKVLFPMWNKEIKEREMIESKNASISTNTSMRERLKKELGIEVRDPIDVELRSNKMFKNPDNFYPELSSDNNIWDLGRRFRNQR